MLPGNGNNEARKRVRAVYRVVALQYRDLRKMQVDLLGFWGPGGVQIAKTGQGG